MLFVRRWNGTRWIDSYVGSIMGPVRSGGTWGFHGWMVRRPGRDIGFCFEAQGNWFVPVCPD